MFNIPQSLLLAAAPEAIASEPDYSSFVLMGVLLTLVVIYLVSKLGGELSKRLNLPPVLGELVGGVIVGVSALHLIVSPEAGFAASDSLIMTALQQLGNLDGEALAHVFESQSEVISILAELGVIVLLFEIGLESDLRELSKVGYQAAAVAVVGVVAPFALGTLGLIDLFNVPTIPAVFAGAALTATSIGITSKVLSELGHLKSREGQIIVGAAVIDDVLGIIVLAVVASLAKTGDVDLLNVL
ncbi:MAG: cation:proton antiporter, partial [Elainellaceae cyanobacterium]